MLVLGKYRFCDCFARWQPMTVMWLLGWVVSWQPTPLMFPDASVGWENKGRKLLTGGTCDLFASWHMWKNLPGWRMGIITEFTANLFFCNRFFGDLALSHHNWIKPTSRHACKRCRHPPSLMRRLASLWTMLGIERADWLGGGTEFWWCIDSIQNIPKTSHLWLLGYPKNLHTSEPGLGRFPKNVGVSGNFFGGKHHKCQWQTRYFITFSLKPKNPPMKINVKGGMLLLMEEILHHLGCKKVSIYSEFNENAM